MAAYLRELESRIQKIKPDVPLRIMVSSGGFTSGRAAAHTPILLLESGPAAGVLSALNTAHQNDVRQVLAFDMGGTSADIGIVADGTISEASARDTCANPLSRASKASGGGNMTGAEDISTGQATIKLRGRITYRDKN